MGLKLDGGLTRSSMSQCPAPGSYDPRHQLKYDGHTKFGQGKRNGMINEKKSGGLPGPMEYQPSDSYSKMAAPKFSFGGGSA